MIMSLIRHLIILKKMNEISRMNAALDLGTMGLAELMIKLEIRYGSPESLVFLDKFYGFMAREAYLASAEIAGREGIIPSIR